MNEDERKAIEVLKNKRIYEPLALSGRMSLDIILNLIEKQSKIIEEKDKRINQLNIENQKHFDNMMEAIQESNLLKEQNEYIETEYGRTIEQKDKVIEEMAQYINNNCLDLTEDIGICSHMADKLCDNCIKEYFRKKVEKNECIKTNR